MISSIYITFVIISFLLLIVSFVYDKKKGVRSSLMLLTAILFSFLSITSFSIENDSCYNYQEIKEGITTDYICSETPYVYDGIGYFFSGLSLYCFIMFLMFIFNQQNNMGKEEWA